MDSEDELSRCGDFIRIFPSLKSGECLKYFDHVFYYDILLNIWEQRFHNKREEGMKMAIRMKCIDAIKVMFITGIEMIRKLAFNKCHLKVSREDSLNNTHV